MLTIKKAAEATGVPEHTLRAWERRYCLFSPARAPSGYRVYDEEAITRIRDMHTLVDLGWSPRDASVEVLRQHQSARTGPEGVQPTVGRDPHLDLVQAAAELDAARVSRILDEQFSLQDYETLVDQWLMPALSRIGKEWAAGTISVAGEHLVSNTVLRRLSAAYEAAGGRGTGRPVLIGAPPGVHHELGLLAFAVALRRAGLPTIYLGADVPLAAWAEAVAAASPAAVVTTAPRRRDAARVAEVADVLRAADPTLPLWVGGRFQDLLPPPGRPLGHRIGAAATLLAAATALDAQEGPWTTK